MEGGAHSGLKEGMKAGAPIALASLLLGTSFGVLAEPVMGTVAPIVMSAIVFALLGRDRSLEPRAARAARGADHDGLPRCLDRAAAA
ncbi:MAG: hypothetical protein M3331_03650 [Actinomycetota bacterium]|nr:hypothetical protein [Actinomycetota bacterium]